MKSLILVFASLLSFSAFATSNLEGEYSNIEGTNTFRLIEFEGRLTFNTRSYYYNGAPSDYFFEFKVPKDRNVAVGETVPGRVRSLDGFYGCVFDEPAKAQLAEDGTLKIHHPLLTFHRETRSVRENRGSGYRRVVDWNGWGWVETVYRFPIERWRVISSECVIVQRNWTTGTLVPLHNQPPVSRP